MPRYIDAYELKKAVLALQDCPNGLSDTYDKSCIIGVIDEQPPADVAPVKRGKWISHGSYFVCSVCKEEQYGVDTGRYYCPNCGARMEGDNGAGKQ